MLKNTNNGCLETDNINDECIFFFSFVTVGENIFYFSMCLKSNVGGIKKAKGQLFALLLF